MPLFTGYFDESGTHSNSPVAVLGGYVATVRQWKEFQVAWNKYILDRENIRVLHRVDLEHFRQEFKDWDRDRQVKVLRLAHKIIKNHTRVAIAQAIVVADFERIMPGVVKRAFGGVYGWAAHDLAIHVSRWAYHHGYREPIEYIFEAGAKGRHQVERMFSLFFDPPLGLKPSPIVEQRLRIRGWAFAPKERFCQFQAADFCVYEFYKHVINQVVQGKVRPVRKSFDDLFRRDDGLFLSHEQHFRRWLQDADDIIPALEEREKMLRAEGRTDLI